MKLNKRSRWIIVVTVLAISSLLFLSQVDVVRAMFDGVHALNVYLRVETEILQKMPAGQYYDSLFWKHVDEVNQIMSAHPEHEEELIRATFMFVPELEALLNGDGDKVYVSSEHVKSLKAELDWFASIGSPLLREDIEKELQRLPLDNFVGMTMNDALDLINSRWAPDMVVQPTLVPDCMAPPTLQATIVADKTLVPDSGGRWAYYVINGVYLEYPASHYFEIHKTGVSCSITFMPFTSAIDWQNPRVITVHISQITVDWKDIQDPSAFYPAGNVVWEGIIQNGEFEGVEFVVNLSNAPGMDIHALQYNRKNQLMVDIQMQVNEDLQVSDNPDYFALINQKYEDFQHMVGSLRIQMP